MPDKTILQGVAFFIVSIFAPIFASNVLLSARTQINDENISAVLKKAVQVRRANKMLEELPQANVDAFFSRDADAAAQSQYLEQCKIIANALHKYGAVLVKDSRVSDHENEQFQDMMEQYFETSDGVQDARPQYHYQVGVTPSGTECARPHSDVKTSLPDSQRPITPLTPLFDLKWRFFWRIGPRPSSTQFPSLNMDPVIPAGFPTWEATLNSWGHHMMSTLFVVSEMTAVGFGMPFDTFSSRMEFGPHLLAPTGSNLAVHNQIDSVLAGFHSDLNFLTIHGKSRYPGLFIWTREGRRLPVRVPPGYLLVQAGKQIEYLTGGHVLAGFHEVIVTPEALKLSLENQAAGKSAWRISTTCFGHIQSDQLLQPLPPFKSPETLAKYPPILTGDQVQMELKAIALDRSG